MQQGPHVRGPEHEEETLEPIIRQHVEAGSNVYTDSLASYAGLNPEFAHDFVEPRGNLRRGRGPHERHGELLGLFKRCIKGTHVSVEPFHLFRYVDAEAFRFNERKDNDGGRFLSALSGIEGKRLTYKNLIGEDQPVAEA